jgi:predicted Zn-ribbon and HTH transcriptional regulator
MSGRDRRIGRPAAEAPASRASTVREALRQALLAGPATARDLSTDVGLREKDVAEHLEHLGRSLLHRGEHLSVEPATCLSCGYVFVHRSRLSRPGACPSCRSTRIDPPVFRIEQVSRE